MSLVSSFLLRRYPELAREIPGPAPSLALGNFIEVASRKPWELSLDYSRRYGPFALTWFANRPVVFVHDPRAIEEILLSKREHFYKGEPCAAMRPAATTSSIFVANGAQWERKRKNDFANDTRYAAWEHSQFAPFQSYLQTKVSRALPIAANTTFETWLTRLLFDSLSHLIFAHEFDERDYARYNHLMDVVDFRMKTNLPLLSPNFKRVRERWFSSIEQVLAANAQDRDGMSISHLLGRHSQLAHEHLIAELSNIFPGGLYSMTSAVAHAMSELYAQPKSWQATRNELANFRETPGLDYTKLSAFAPLERILREAMRLHAPAPVFLRTTSAQHVDVGGLQLRQGVRVIIGIYGVQRDPTYWSQPDRFLPERWTPAALAENPYGSRYFCPFGRGPRTCAGQTLALFVMRSLLFTLLSDPSLHVALSKAQDHRFYFGCIIPRGITGTMHRLSDSQADAMPKAA